MPTGQSIQSYKGFPSAVVSTDATYVAYGHVRQELPKKEETWPDEHLTQEVAP